jgi:hypothetical protein
MEASVRTPFQGVTNIIRFNWHFYVTSSGIVLLLISSLMFVSTEFSWIVKISVILILITTFISLAVSYYVYDYSGLYNFDWFNRLPIKEEARILNIHAGFDETSLIIKARYPKTHLSVFDFYDPEKHTEASIERARRAYAPYPDTIKISTDQIPVATDSIDLIFNIFSIHEIRNSNERIHFLTMQYEVLKTAGRCVIVEHLRDLTNFAAYNVGFLHFLALKEWQSNFSAAGFEIESSWKITPFVSVFMLKKKHGNTP